METGYSVTAWCLVGARQVWAGDGCVTGLHTGGGNHSRNEMLPVG